MRHFARRYRDTMITINPVSAYDIRLPIVTSTCYVLLTRPYRTVYDVHVPGAVPASS